MEETARKFEELTIGHAPDLFKIAPSRGGIVTELVLGGESLLYLDRATFDDPSKSVRGGIPVLFPICGPLRDDRWPRGELKQHGFARNLPWTVAEQTDDSVTLRLDASDATRAAYPFDFALRYFFQIRPGALRISQLIENRSQELMPFSAGFHPYFEVQDKSRLHFEIPAKHAGQNPFGDPQPFNGFDFDLDAIDLTFTDATEPAASFDDGARRIRVSASEDYHYLVFWTLKDRPFICLEPWTARGDALNTKVDLIEIAPGETRHLWMEIARTAPVS